MRTIKVSILGLGVVGSQLLTYLLKEHEKIRTLYGVEIVVTQIYVSNLKKERDIDLSGIQLTQDGYQAIDAADIVFECIGGKGTELARKLLLYALKSQKGVIISSKKCLAQYGEELTTCARENHTPLCYDAAVGGGIPISRTLSQMGKAETITKIYGICNATSNYILTQMSENKIPFEKALQQAQTMGIAENDPTQDVDGYDSLYKATILAGFGFHKWLSDKNFMPSSIRKISLRDISEADEKGQTIKQIFEIKQVDHQLQCKVETKPVSQNQLLAHVDGMNNMIIIETSESGERAFWGYGAGAKPTASAMFDDLISLLQ